VSLPPLHLVPSGRDADLAKRVGSVAILGVFNAQTSKVADVQAEAWKSGFQFRETTPVMSYIIEMV